LEFDNDCLGDDCDKFELALSYEKPANEQNSNSSSRSFNELPGAHNWAKSHDSAERRTE
jgi:hypothetical protein